MTKHYKYFNRNPKNHKESDCVCRAISTATNLDYYAVNKLLLLTAEHYNCDKLCVCCYHNLLENILNYERVNCYFKKTVEDIAEEYPRDTLLVRIDEHLTTIIKGNILDIWDCSKQRVDCFWFVT